MLIITKYLACTIFFLLVLSTQADYISSCNYDSRNFSCRPDIYWCSSISCQPSHCEYNTEDSILVRVGSACLIPKNFFRDSPNLVDISGSNSGIEMLAPGSFVNLPRVINIKMAFNLIRYVFQDTFVNVAVRNLDLSWNKISYVEEKAFKDLHQLQSLDLSYNDLFQQPEQLPRELRQLYLSHNFLKFALLSRDITVADFSHNQLTSIGLPTVSNLEMLDISMNQLEESSAFSYIKVKRLKIAFNNFMQYPGYMEFSPQEIQLYPNPWDCDSLKSTWQDFYEARVKVIQASLDQKYSGVNDSFPVCISYGRRNREEIKNRFRRLYKSYTNEKQCISNEHCSDNEICRSGHCWNPCRFNVCDEDNECTVQKHKVVCYCKANSGLTSFVDRSRCYFISCFSDKDCPKGQFCNRRICEEIPHL